MISSIEIKPIPIKDRYSYIYVEMCNLDVIDGALVIIHPSGSRTPVPIGGLTCLMLGPGTRISHAVVNLASEVKCLLIWTGEHGVRLYSAGVPGGHRSDRLMEQASAALNPISRMEVVRRMYSCRFNEIPPSELSVEQLRGKEAVRVKMIYRALSQKYSIEWSGRRYDAKNWQSADSVNRCISAATSCLYSITEAAVLIAGYSPAIGFVHSGRPRSFVYDIADLVKYDTVIPLAFQIASENPSELERTVRISCRDLFRDESILNKIIPLMESMFEGIITTMPEGCVESPEFSEQDGMCYDGSGY